MAFEPTGKTPALFSHEMRVGLSWRLFVFLAITLSSFALAYAGLEFGYKAFLNASIADYNKRALAVPAKFGPGEQDNLIGFYSQITNLKSLFSKHNFSSNALAFLEESTGIAVAFTNASVDIKSGTMTLDGVADSYTTLAGQMVYLEKNKSVKSVTLGQNSLDKGLVRFSLKLTLVDNLFKINKSQ